MCPVHTIDQENDNRCLFWATFGHTSCWPLILSPKAVDVNVDIVDTGIRHSCWTLQCSVVITSVGGEHRWSLLYWQWSSVRHLSQQPQAVITHIWWPQPPCVCYHEWCNNLPQVHIVHSACTLILSLSSLIYPQVKICSFTNFSVPLRGSIYG